MIDQHNTLPNHSSNHSFHQHFCGTKCISWSAIVAGALVGLGLSFLLNLFGVAIGLSAFTTSPQGIVTLAVGGFIGLIIGVVATMFFAGWVTGYLGRTCCFNRHCGALYGLITWCLSLILTILLTAHVGQFMSMRSHSLSYPTSIIVATTNEDTSTLLAKNQNNPDFGSNSTQTTVVNEKQIVRDLGKSLFLTFLLFLLGAVSSCFGGYCGLKPKTNCNEINGPDFQTQRKIV